MKNLYILMLFLFLLSGCEDEKISISEECTYNAVVEDFSGLDGCGYLFKLDNGEYLQPYWRWGFCGTPPFPEGATEDPLWDFEYKAGKRVRIGFQYADHANICMKGRVAIITCLETIDEPPADEYQ